jgi:hypothetical protein
MLTPQPDVVKYTDTYYPSALQAVIWEISYLRKMLKTASNPWQFERQKASQQHFAVRNSFIHYIHIIEKGLLRQQALEYLESSAIADLDTRKESKPKALISNLKCIKYSFLGYLFSK